MPMNLKAVAGAIRSKKTPLALKQGLLKKYGSQLKKEFGGSLPKESASTSKALSINPPKGAVKIYDKIEEIKAQKGKDSLWPKEHFKHSFKGKSEGAIYGMPDGSLLIKGNKPLWKNFNYPERTKK